MIELPPEAWIVLAGALAYAIRATVAKRASPTERALGVLIRGVQQIDQRLAAMSTCALDGERLPPQVERALKGTVREMRLALAEQNGRRKDE